jgi:N-acetylglucosamine malate deacetylase 1
MKQTLKKPFIKIIVRWVLVLTIIFSIAGVAFYFAQKPAVSPQSLIQSLSDAKIPYAQQKVLVFAPHPDDETIAVGGYIANAQAQGAVVRIVLITDGNKHRKEAIRYQEFREATSILGVSSQELVFLGFPDGNLRKLDQSKLSEALRKQIEAYKPDFIIYPHARDAHPDHYTAGRIIREILNTHSTSEPIAYEYLVHFKFLYPQPYRFAPYLYLAPPKNLVTENVEWLRFVLPQGLEDLKLKAIRMYGSQLNDPLLRQLINSSVRRNELLVRISR